MRGYYTSRVARFAAAFVSALLQVKGSSIAGISTHCTSTTRTMPTKVGKTLRVTLSCFELPTPDAVPAKSGLAGRAICFAQSDSASSYYRVRHW